MKRLSICIDGDYGSGNLVIAFEVAKQLEYPCHIADESLVRDYANYYTIVGGETLKTALPEKTKEASDNDGLYKKPFFLSDSDLAWVESTFAAMTQEEKLNQVFVDMLWNEPPKEIEAHQSACQLGGYRYNNSPPEKLWEQNAAIQRAARSRL